MSRNLILSVVKFFVVIVAQDVNLAIGGGSSMLVKIEAYHDGQFWCARGIGEES